VWYTPSVDIEGLSALVARPFMDWQLFITGLKWSGRRKNPIMEVKLYIGNLSFSTREDDLRTLLNQAGTVVSADLIKDRSTGQSKGFAFVVMASQAEAAKATQMFNGYTLDDRQIKVGPAREDTARGDYSKNRGSSQGPRRPVAHKNRGGARRY
jgi:RNA recognition motif-containing protein